MTQALAQVIVGRGERGGSRAALTDFLGEVLQQVLAEAQVSQVGEVADASGQRRKLIIGEHQFLHRG